MFTLIVKQRAIEMAREAYQWYEEQQTGLGDLFLNDVDDCFDRIEASPELYAKIRRNFRQIILRRFPYVLVFEVLKDEVIVYAVFHTSRNPQKKFKK